MFRSCLSYTVLPICFVLVGKYPLVYCLMTRIFNAIHPIKKFIPTWSVMVVFQTLKQWAPPEKIDWICLTYKVVMLLTLAAAKSCSSIILLSLKLGYCEISET